MVFEIVKKYRYKSFATSLPVDIKVCKINRILRSGNTKATIVSVII